MLRVKCGSLPGNNFSENKLKETAVRAKKVLPPFPSLVFGGLNEFQRTKKKYIK